MFDRLSLRALSVDQKLGLLTAGAILGVAALTALFLMSVMDRDIGLAIGALVLAAVLLAAGWVTSRGLLRQLSGEAVATAYIARRIAECELAVHIDQQPAARPSQPGTASSSSSTAASSSSFSSSRLRRPVPPAKPQGVAQLATAGGGRLDRVLTPHSRQPQIPR